MGLGNEDSSKFRTPSMPQKVREIAEFRDMGANHNLSAFPRRRRFGVRRHDAAFGIPKSESGGMPPHTKAAGEEWLKILGLLLPPAAQNVPCGAWRKCGQLCIRARQEF
jgi:hypothetical protein